MKKSVAVAAIHQGFVCLVFTPQDDLRFPSNPTCVGYQTLTLPVTGLSETRHSHELHTGQMYCSKATGTYPG